MNMIQRYQKRISGPLMDRIDIHLEVKRVPFQKLADVAQGETSAVIRQRVEAARHLDLARFTPLDKPHVLINRSSTFYMGVDVVATGVSLAGAGGVKVVRADRDFFLANSSAKLVYLLGLLPYNKVTSTLGRK